MQTSPASCSIIRVAMDPQSSPTAGVARAPLTSRTSSPTKARRGSVASGSMLTQVASAAFPGRIWFKINRNGKFKFKLKALGKALARRITVALLDEFGVPAAGITVKAKKLSVTIKAKSLAAGRYYLDLTTLFPTAVTYDAKFSYKAK